MQREIHFYKKNVVGAFVILVDVHVQFFGAGVCNLECFFSGLGEGGVCATIAKQAFPVQLDRCNKVYTPMTDNEPITDK